MRKRFEKMIVLLGQGWFGISNPFSSAFETYSGATGRAVEIINWFIGLMAVIAVGVIIYAGYSFSTAGGDEEKIDQAKHTITTAVIGLGIAFTAAMGVRFMVETLFK
jgi:hypothetical protein